MAKNKPFASQDYEILNKDTLYKGKFTLSKITLRHKLFEGGWTNQMDREVYERDSAVAVLPYDPAKDRVILIEQFRVGSLADPESPWQIEIPAGIIEPNEKPDEVAHRETFEETGCKILELTPMFKYFVSPGGSNEFLHLYCAKIDSTGIDGIHGLKNENENIRVLNVSIDEALQMMDEKKIKNAPTIISLLWLKQLRSEGIRPY